LEQYKQITGEDCEGLNAINMGLLLWGYDKPMKREDYSPMHVPLTHQNWEISGEDFYHQNIKKAFTTHAFITYHAVTGLNYTFQWDYINNNNYTKYSIIALGGYGLGTHYFLIIGVDINEMYYLLVDTLKNIWIVEKKLMRTLCVYTNNGYLQHSLYKIGGSKA